MPKRQSIHIEGFVHKNPIPSACRLGNMLMSGIITGIDPATGKVAPTLEAAVRLHVRACARDHGRRPAAVTDDIIKMTVWMADRSKRDAVNAEWLKMFPDEQRARRGTPCRPSSKAAS